jgi:hypothetical protein
MVFVPRRSVVSVVVAALAAAAPIGLGGCGSDTDRPQTAQAPTALVTIEAGRTERRVPFGFLGLSLEYPAVEAYAGTDPAAPDPVFVQLVRNLVPGQAPVLRIGGDSADRTWWPTPGLTQPPGVKFSITRRWLSVTRGLADALGARLIVGLNLEADRPQLAASEATALLRGIGSQRVRAFELGNEPDLYATFPWYRTPSGQHVTGRPPGYDLSGLIGDFTRFAAVLPTWTVAGPSLGAPGWTRQLVRFLDAVPRLGLVTLHRYPLQLCYSSPGSPHFPTITRLLSPSSSIGLADSFAPYAAAARARGLSLRVDELNSVSCGADPAVSQTFASALWVLNTLFEMLRVGVHGVNIHTFPGAGYELFKLSRSGGLWRADVAPEYYGLLLFARAAAAGSRLLAVAGGADGTVRTWATRAGDGTVRVVFVNTGAAARRLSIGVPGMTFATGSLQRLTARSVRAQGGMTLAGQSFAAGTSTGRLAGAPLTSRVPAVGGRYVVQVPAASAAMLVLSPPS